MTHPLTVAGICGSLRKNSHSRALMLGIAKLLPGDTVFTEIDPGTLPHYNQDNDGDGTPIAVAAARGIVQASDALIVVTPEFNHGLPGVLKNTLDWLSRPAFASCCVGKPVMFATISPGALGGVRAQYQLRETFSSMLCRLAPLPEIAVTHAPGKFENGRLVDAQTIQHTQSVLASFLRHCPVNGRDGP